MISVVLPCYHEPREIFVQALNSMLSQTYGNLELIVVVDGPNPDLEQLLCQYQKQDNRLRFYVNEINRGLPYSLNRGISLAKGEYIARMDADDISLSERLEKELKYLKKNNLELVGTHLELISESGEHIGFVFAPSCINDIYRTLLQKSCIGHPTWLFRKDVWERVGGYDNFRGCEDYHFLLKARKLGVRLGVLPEVCLKYRLTKGGLSRERSAKTEVIVNFLKKHYEDVFHITPEYFDRYFNSEEGEKALKECESYFKLATRFHSSGYLLKLWYGVRMFQSPYGREALRLKINQFLDNHK